MHIKYILLVIFILPFIKGCNQTEQELKHLGNKIPDQKLNLRIDSIVIDAIYTSGTGSYFMIDSSIFFADEDLATIYEYDYKTGELKNKLFGLGRGANELPKFIFAYPIQNDTLIYIVDRDLGAYSYGLKEQQIHNLGFIDFNWKETLTSDEQAIENYNLNLETSYGFNIYRLDSSTLIIPVNKMRRYEPPSNKIYKKQYEKGHMLGLLNTETMKVEKLFGKFPELYKKQLMPQMEFFSYIMNNDTLYVSFAADSLIYAYQYPDKLLFTFGYECKDIDRSYTISSIHGPELQKDFKRVGYSTELKYTPQTGFYLRTYYKNFKDFGMQIYDRHYDLLADFSIPFCFKLLGYKAPFYYGVSLRPRQTDDHTFVTFYKFKLES